MQRLILAIDPGNIQSAFCLVNYETLKPIKFEKLANVDAMSKMLNVIWEYMCDAEIEIVIEKVTSYGQEVGSEVFDTCVWIGRFLERLQPYSHKEVILLPRMKEKMYLCGTPRANDRDIKNALIETFAAGVANYGKGSKKEPGWFYGFRADIWSAYAVAVTHAYMEREKDGRVTNGA